MTISSALRFLRSRRPLILHAAAWTLTLTATVAVASFSPELAFVWATSSSAAGKACGPGSVRVPLGGPPGEVVCLPTRMFGRSKADLIVPPVFAALVVAGSACFIRAIGLWESPERYYYYEEGDDEGDV